jgi:two-component system CheB/CheR fusion protein
MHELIERAASFVVEKLKQANVEMAVQFNADNDCVLVDKVQIKQVLVNLIRNAGQAMSETERRQLTISTTTIDNGMVQVDVMDTGSGLSDQEKSRIFQPFVTTKDYGMGIGLSISRSIVEAHYGELWAEQNHQGGAIFSFTLPIVSRYE